MTEAKTIMMICVVVMDAPITLKVTGWNKVGKERGLGPINGRARGKFSRNMETPTAVISAIILGLLRSGRYAMTSVPTAIPPVPSMAIMMMIPTISIGYVPSI